MNDLRFEQISESLLAELPELRARYERDLSWWQGPGRPNQYTVFGFVVKPALWDLLSPGNNTAMLKRIFGFFERMASSSDLEVVNLLQVEIFESLIGEREKVRAAWGYMGENTRSVARKIARTLRYEQNLPSS